MSYDPRDYSVEWRDVGAGCLLFAAALLGLVTLGGNSPVTGGDIALLSSSESAGPDMCQGDECEQAVTYRIVSDDTRDAAPRHREEKYALCTSAGARRFF